jgi:hypothetical protein
MSIFKSVGIVVDAVVSVLVRTAKTVENFVEVLEITSESLVTETKLDNQQTLAEGKAKLAALEKKLAKEQSEANQE